MARKNSYIQEIDKFIGEKIYSLRLAKGLSRQQLAKMIEVTHQQLQKYEKGLNRISVGRLIMISNALEEHFSHFHEGIDNMSSHPVATKHQRMCIEVSRNFMKIPNPDHQSAINSLVKSLLKPPYKE
ncbi:helix-turn-helix domain-containing protein [Rickettsia endosymbiont of Cardiosporidium cionae]|uniref:helix-turn-helix domain-containing protein n=1 Tax=Rickettsia endosymbiont of Cardiosporidium cionae TaxID=2777155 RepID=UPI0018952362|nr:helix-turn-helix transcriptional regulator [Rickettsia endosymbiont of Cardiosporidium cionae]KAF8818731.1 XRE family transcriptional regulator [Rickettsia endosymbiont of Cardiosporidium cionae]